MLMKNNFELKKRTIINENHIIFQLSPLDSKVGSVIGNSLRRILLSSIPGVAISRAHITGVAHEFSTMDGVREDVCEILQNLKAVNIKNMGKDIRGVGKILIQGPHVVTARDIQLSPSFQVVNPSQHIATITSKRLIAIDLDLKEGIGFETAGNSPTQIQKKQGKVAYMNVDAIFNPIEKVAFTVNEIAESSMEELLLEVKTTGAVTAEDAVALAAKIMVDHLALFAEMEHIDTTQAIGNYEDRKSKSLKESIESLDCSPRLYNKLKRIGIVKIEDLMIYSECDLLKIRGVSRHMTKELSKRLETLGLSLKEE